MSDNIDDGVINDMTSAMAATNIRDEDATKRSREAGWGEPTRFDYDAYRPISKEEREMTDQANLPKWAAEAERFEWKEE